MLRPREYEMRRLTLRLNPVLEKQFVTEYLRTSLDQIRAGILVAALLTAASLAALAFSDPGGSGYWRRPSGPLLLYWSSVPVMLVGLTATYWRQGTTWVRLAIGAPIAWFS